MDLHELLGAVRRFDDFLERAIADLDGPARTAPDGTPPEAKPEPSKLTIADLDVIPLRRASPASGRLHRIDIGRRPDVPAEAAE